MTAAVAGSQAEQLARGMEIAFREAHAAVQRGAPWRLFDDLYAAGRLGVAAAMRDYDPTTGVPFGAYARLRVHGSVLDELRRQDPLSRQVRSALRRHNRAQEQLWQELQRSPTDAEIAERAGTTTAEVHEARAAALMVAPDLLPEVDDWLFLSDMAVRVDACVTAGWLWAAIGRLPDREREVLIRHYVHGEKQDTIAADLQVTPSRVSQILTAARARLRELLDGSDVG